MSSAPSSAETSTLVSETNPLGLDGKTIAGIVVAILFAAGLIAGTIYMLISWRRTRRRRMVVPTIGSSPVNPHPEKHVYRKLSGAKDSSTTVNVRPAEV